MARTKKTQPVDLAAATQDALAQIGIAADVIEVTPPKKSSPKAKKTAKPAPKSKAKGDSRSPLNRKRRRIQRQLLQLAMVALDDEQDAETIAWASARVESLETQLAKVS